MEIRETIKDFLVTFPFDREKLTAVKAIAGSWFQANAKVWHVPKFRTREINFLRQKFNVHELKTDDVFTEEIYEEIPQMPDLDVDLPLLLKPYGYQEKGIAYGRIKKRVIIGDQPGLGKTLQAIGIVSSFGINPDKMLTLGPGLVICPSSLKINWEKEWMEVAGRRAMILRDSIKNSWQQYYNVGMCDVFIVNFEGLRKYFVQPGWSKPGGTNFRMNQIPFKDSINIFKWVIVDEFHKIKDGSTMQSKITMGIARGKEIVLGLTGTPVLNKTLDLVSQLHTIDRLKDVVSHIPRPIDKHGNPTDYGGYKRFLERYCGGGSKSTNLKELNYRLNKFCFFRREKKDVLKELPEKKRQVVRCDITNRHDYDHALKEFIQWLRETKDSTDPAVKRRRNAMALIRIGTLKQISARGKLEAAREFIEEVVDGGQKIVVFVHLKEIASALKEMFPEAVSVTGDDSMEERDRAIAEFQKCNICGTRLESHKNKNHDHVLSDTKVIICSSAGGEGVTLTAASEVVLIEFPWTYAKCEQYEDRTHRISQDNNVRATYLLGDNTIDEWCYDIIQKKKSISQDVTGATDDVPEEMIDNLLNLFNQK